MYVCKQCNAYFLICITYIYTYCTYMYQHKPNPTCSRCGPHLRRPSSGPSPWPGRPLSAPAREDGSPLLSDGFVDGGQMPGFHQLEESGDSEGRRVVLGVRRSSTSTSKSASCWRNALVDYEPSAIYLLISKAVAYIKSTSLLLIVDYNYLIKLFTRFCCCWHRFPSVRNR